MGCCQQRLTADGKGGSCDDQIQLWVMVDAAVINTDGCSRTVETREREAVEHEVFMKGLRDRDEGSGRKHSWKHSLYKAENHQLQRLLGKDGLIFCRAPRPGGLIFMA